MQSFDPNNPLNTFFTEAVQGALNETDAPAHRSDVEAYLASLLAEFMHADRIYAIRDASGKPVTNLADMLAEGDVRLKAASFDREREVHKHVGDFVLFWSGMFPEFLTRSSKVDHHPALEEAIRQGRFSYGLVGSYEHDPYQSEAPTFRKLSEAFEVWVLCLKRVRSAIDTFPMFDRLAGGHH